jgi:hypothetical protein
MGNCSLKKKAQHFFEISVAVYHFALNNIPEDFLFVTVMFLGVVFQ